MEMTTWLRSVRWTGPITRPVNWLKKRFGTTHPRQKVEDEIYTATAYIRNKLQATGGKGLTTDAVLESLMQRNKVLYDEYAHMLSLLRVNEKEKAIEDFSCITKDNTAREFARLLFQLDYMQPDEMYTMLQNLQTELREKKVTELKKQEETISDILYFPVVINVILIIFNFVYIGYFMQQKDMLSMLL